MSFHDKIAKYAFSKGKSSEEFYKAAQTHAGSTWFFAIGAGIVWYFFGKVWATIPGVLAVYSTIKSISSTLTADKIEKLERNFASK